MNKTTFCFPLTVPLFTRNICTFDPLHFLVWFGLLFVYDDCDGAYLNDDDDDDDDDTDHQVTSSAASP